MKKYYNYLIFGMVIVIGIVIGILIIDKLNNDSVDQPEETPIDENYKLGETEDEDDIDESLYICPEYVSKALAVKMVALSQEDKSKIVARDREISYSDSTSKDWFDKYFNLGIVSGWYINTQEQLNPLNPLTYQDLQGFIDYFEINLAQTNINIEEVDAQEAVLYSDWIEIYHMIIDQVNDTEGVYYKTLYVFSTPALSSELAAWEMATDNGKYYFEGVAVDGCINKEISALVRGNEVIYIKGIVSGDALLTNAYIIDVDTIEKQAKVFMGGITRSIEIASNIVKEAKENIIADIKIKDNVIVEMTEKNQIVTGTIKKISDKVVELDGYGQMNMLEDTKYYSYIDELEFSNYRDIVVGYALSDIVLDVNNEVAAIIIKDKATIESIRVVVNNTGFNGLVHPNVSITSDGKYSVIKGDVEQMLDPLYELDIDKVNYEVGERIIVMPEQGKRIAINSITRGYGENTFNPQYRGIIEIEKVEGGYIIVNEVDFEEYLYSVVPSEMPSYYGLEALKVQAISARSYAYSQFYANRYCQYGAHVDDSTSCQVYNNTMETSDSIAAVNETKGKALSYNGNIISANFFSTSCGVTSNSGEVWADYATKDFPTVSTDYLVSKYQYDEGDLDYDLSNDEGFRAFILDEQVLSYDSDFAWYRWSTSMSSLQIQESINKSICTRYENAPKLIKTLDENNIFRSRTVEDIGELIDLWVYSRGDSGIVTEMIIEGTKGVFKVATEYNIRLLLAPSNYVADTDNVVITRLDDSTVNNMGLMPSAYFVIDKIYDENSKLAEVIFYGGGYGHGVGMSQNGVKTMVDKGYNYEEILHHYFEGTDIIKMN